MTEHSGVLRSSGGLSQAARTLGALAGESTDDPSTAAWETTNLLTVSAVLVGAARLREETRGSHWREDYPDRDDAWAGHIDTRMGPDGRLHPAYHPGPGAVPFDEPAIASGATS
jgi:L-aspartate oxidase